MSRTTLLTPKEVSEIRSKYMQLSVDPDLLILHLHDALACINELKEKKIPIYGHDYYWILDNDELKEDGSMMGIYYDTSDSDWISKVLEKYEYDIRQETIRDPDESKVVEIILSPDCYIEVNSSSAVPEAIRISKEEAHKQNHQLSVERDARNREIN